MNSASQLRIIPTIVRSPCHLPLITHLPLLPDSLAIGRLSTISSLLCSANSLRIFLFGSKSGSEVVSVSGREAVYFPAYVRVAITSDGNMCVLPLLSLSICQGCIRGYMYAKINQGPRFHDICCLQLASHGHPLVLLERFQKPVLCDDNRRGWVLHERVCFRQADLHAEAHRYCLSMLYIRAAVEYICCTMRLERSDRLPSNAKDHLSGNLLCVCELGTACLGVEVLVPVKA